MDFEKILNWITDNWQMVAAMVPTVGLAVTWLAKKFGRAGLILWGLITDMRDHVLSDEEIAMRFWQIISISLGLGWNVSTWVLDYAPSHQIAYLKYRKFIPTTYRPDVLPWSLPPDKPINEAVRPEA